MAPRELITPHLHLFLRVFDQKNMAVKRVHTSLLLVLRRKFQALNAPMMKWITIKATTAFASNKPEAMHRLLSMQRYGIRCVQKQTWSLHLKSGFNNTLVELEEESGERSVHDIWHMDHLRVGIVEGVKRGCKTIQSQVSVDQAGSFLPFTHFL